MIPQIHPGFKSIFHPSPKEVMTRHAWTPGCGVHDKHPTKTNGWGSWRFPPKRKRRKHPVFTSNFLGFHSSKLLTFVRGGAVSRCVVFGYIIHDIPCCPINSSGFFTHEHLRLWRCSEGNLRFSLWHGPPGWDSYQPFWGFERWMVVWCLQNWRFWFWKIGGVVVFSFE